MKQILLIADDLRDLDGLGGPWPMASSRDYVERPAAFAQRGLRLINLSRSYSYQSLGYYVSLLAEARGHRVMPSVETTLDLASRSDYARALPELEAALNKDLGDEDELPEELYLLLGVSEDPRCAGFARLLFDWFRAPVLCVRMTRDGKVNQVSETADTSLDWIRIQRIRAGAFGKLSAERKDLFATTLAAQNRGVWRSPKSRLPARYSMAVLYDPAETLPPSSQKTLQHFARVAEREGMEVEPIRKRDLARLAEFDALFIRETTSIRNHTYRFAQRARAEGMPVIDDPVSMIRCTNKVYLWERLQQANLPTPPTQVLRRATPLEQVADQFGFPMVVKIPDGSFSRGVKKAEDLEELRAVTQRFAGESELLLVQKYLPTRFDWRIGVLGGEPLFACQYLMARNHWQIVDHRTDGKSIEGGFKTFALSDVAPEVLDVAVSAARLIGDGLYGVDLKETPEGVMVIEINDNPNLEHGVEDAIGKQEIWLRLSRWFISKLRG